MPRVPLLLSILCSAVYSSSFVLGSFPGRWAVKAASITLLAFLARKYPLLALALALGSVGDALLDISSAYFVYGLVAFLLGHVVYTICFMRTGRLRPGGLAAVGLVIYSAVFVVWLWPSLGAMRVPVLIYIAAITAMAATSFRVGGWVAVGAVLFLISDSLLAANRFKMEIPLRDWLVWLTYYGGQVAIALGYLKVFEMMETRAYFAASSSWHSHA